jgi:hypothetical protein
MARRALLVGFLGSAYGFGTHPAVPVQQRSARARCLPQLNVQNLRPVSPSLPGIYRSAAFEQATDADAALILDGMRIRTVIDLRSQDEIDKALAAATPVGRALFAAYADGAPVGPGQLASEGTGRLRRVHVPLLADVDAFWEFVATKLSPAKRAEAMLYRSVDGKRYDRLRRLAGGRERLSRSDLISTHQLSTHVNWRAMLLFTTLNKVGYRVR